jgi:hypothetical protein
MRVSKDIPRPLRFGGAAPSRREPVASLTSGTEQRAGQLAPLRRMAGALRSAESQILARPLDPLSVSVSYVIMRNGIGALGIAFPIVLIVGGGLDHLQPSLSAYYHFAEASPARYGAGTMRDAFVGMLCAIGAFLFFYRGHSLQEDLALNVAGIAAVIVAIFPMDWPSDPTLAGSTTSMLHSIAATAFFLMIGYVCVFRARDTLCIVDDANRRKAFKRIYLVLGVLMLATPAAIAVLEAVDPAAQNGHTTLLVESAGVFVFATYWLVKGFEIRSALHRTMPIESA